MKTSQEQRELKNVDLKEVVTIAKSKGYNVYTFESSSKYIEQIFIEDLEGGRVGSASAYYSGIQFSTVHKSKRGSGNGTGFGGLIKGENFNDPQDLDICFIHMPYWGHAKESNVVKYTSFEDYLKTHTILNYYKI